MKFHSAVYIIILIVKLFMYADKWNKVRLLSEARAWPSFEHSDLFAVCIQTAELYHNSRLKFKSSSECSMAARDKDGILMVEAEETEVSQQINSSKWLSVIRCPPVHRMMEIE